MGLCTRPFVVVFPDKGGASVFLRPQTFDTDPVGLFLDGFWKLFGSCGVQFRNLLAGPLKHTKHKTKEVIEKMKVALAYGVLQRSSFHFVTCAPLFWPKQMMNFSMRILTTAHSRANR